MLYQLGRSYGRQIEHSWEKNAQSLLFQLHIRKWQKCVNEIVGIFVGF